MRSRSFLLTGGVVLAGAACARGTSLGGSSGVGGVGGTADATASSTSSSSFLAASSSSSTTTSTSSSSSGACTESPCKLTSPQCGCGAGQECTIVTYMPACQSAGTSTQGEGCAAPGDCAPGLLCVGGGTTGVCDQFCATDADCAALGGICALDLSNGNGGSIANATLCSTDCNPTSNSGCSVSGTSCQLGQEAAGQMRFLTFCASSGTMGDGETCTTSSDCLPTYGCINNGIGDVCLQYCDVSDPSACGGQGCAGIEDTMTMADIIVNGITLGSCP